MAANSAGLFHLKQRGSKLTRAVFQQYVLCLRLDLGAALGAGDHNPPLPYRHPANRLAVFTGEVPVFSVGAAGGGIPPAAFDPPGKIDPPLVFRPALVEILGEHSGKDVNHQDKEHSLKDTGYQMVF